MSSLKYFSFLAILLCFFVSCKNNVEKGIAPVARKVIPKMATTKYQPNEIAKLSEYPFFEGKIADTFPIERFYRKLRKQKVNLLWNLISQSFNITF